MWSDVEVEPSASETGLDAALPIAQPADDVALLAHVTRELDAVEAALARLEAGSFDTCEVCGREVGRERLLAEPLLTRCSDHTALRTAPPGANDPVGTTPDDPPVTLRPPAVPLVDLTESEGAAEQPWWLA